MGTYYDEDLADNVFFQTLREDYSDIFFKAIYEGCIISVPRAGSLSTFAITIDDVLSHILIPNEEMPETHFRTLNDRLVNICNKTVTVEYENDCQLNSYILFEETYYTEDLFKYKVICLEYPLEPKSDSNLDGVIELRTLRDCIDLLWSQSKNKHGLELFDETVQEFMFTNFFQDGSSIQKLMEISWELYVKCLRIVMKEHAHSPLSPHSVRSIKLSVETYMHHGIYKMLFDQISSCTSQDDSHLNKIIRNSSELQLRDLDIRPDLYELIPRARLELSKISGYSTVLGKINCLRKMINAISNGSSFCGSLAADDILPAIIFIILKTNISNWYAHLNYIKHFNHSRTDDCADDDAFFITTLEAALEHIKSGVFLGSSGSEGQSYVVPTMMTKDLKSNVVSQLFNAVSQGNLKVVKTMIENAGKHVEYNTSLMCHPLCLCDNCNNLVTENSLNGNTSVHEVDDNGLSALHVAAMYGRPVILDYLLTQNSQVNATDVNNYTPLHYAALKGHQSAVLLLAQSGADVNALDNMQNTPLHLSCNNGHDGCAKALIYLCEHVGLPLNINAQNINGDTPLHNAARWGYLTLVKLLIDNNADPSISNRKRLSPFDVSNNSKVWEILAQAKQSGTISRNFKSCTYDFLDDNPNRWIECGDLPRSTDRLKRVDKLLRAVTHGDTNLACFYLGLDPRLLDGRTCHPLCACPQCNSVKSFSSVANKQNTKLNVNECNFEGFTALHVAASHGVLDLVNILSKNGALVDVQTRTKMSTPLILACQNQRVQVVKLLLERGCNVDVQDSKGNTALHYSVIKGDQNLVKAIMSFRPNLTLKNKNGKTALQEAESRIALSLVDLLRGQ